MDVTPTRKMLESMLAFTEAVAGEEPTKLEQSPAANERRKQRRMVMDWLHNFSRLNMREGIGRYLRERGKPTVEDHVRPSKVNRAVNDALNG